MNKKLHFLTISFLLTINSSFAMSAKHQHDIDPKLDRKSLHEKASSANCADTVNIKVNGLVCDFCARAVEKVFSKKAEVSGINVDLDNGNITVAMKPGKMIDNQNLKTLITDSGYDVVDIQKGCNNE